MRPHPGFLTDYPAARGHLCAVFHGAPPGEALMKARTAISSTLALRKTTLRGMLFTRMFAGLRIVFVHNAIGERGRVVVRKRRRPMKNGGRFAV